MIKVLVETLRLFAILAIFSMGIVGLASIMIGENLSTGSEIE
jgi:hypothetical protein